MNRYMSKKTLEIRSLALREATKQLETIEDPPKIVTVIPRNLPKF